MSTLGRLAAVTPSAGVNTLIYTTPPGSSGIIMTVNICNTDSVDVIIRLAFVNGVVVDLASEDWVEYDVVVRAGGLIVRQIKPYVGQSIIGYSDSSSVNFQVWG